MKRFSEQLNKKAMTVKLRAAERRELRERVVSYMEYHPLPKTMKNTKPAKEQKLMTEPYATVAVPWKMLGRWAVGTFAIVLVALPFMAERSVPGDGLYAIKRFNEEVRGTLVFDSVQKVEWETERLNRRIAEARLLASEGRLTDEVEAEVAEDVRTHSDNAQKNIEVLRAEDADEATLAAIALETTLSVQSAALQEDDNEDVSEDGRTADTRPSILATAVEESRVKTTANNASSTIPAFGKVMAKVEQNTTRVYELLDSIRETASEEQIAEITRRIEDIERSVQEAIELKDEDDNQARELLVNSLQRAQKLVVFMTDIEVSETVDIESIVPVVLTDEEKQAILTDLETQLDEMRLLVNEAVQDLDDEELIEKTETVIEEVDTLLSEIEAEADFKTTKENLVSALALIENIFTLLNIEENETPDETESDIEVDIGTSTEPVASSTSTTTDETADETDGEEGATDETETETDSATSTATSTASTTTSVDTE